ncbi:UNVERIFIED_CONTAM: hypothetical protein RF648_20630, partial [Kocuria sp. CPCC 205274]
MKKIAIIVGAALVAASLSGCTGSRPLNQYDRAAILGASEAQALQNAHDAAYGTNGYEKSQEEYRYNQSRKHHKHHNEGVYDDTQNDVGVVYKHGRKGYLDANGDFHS